MKSAKGGKDQNDSDDSNDSDPDFFVFKLADNSGPAADDEILVDCGATTHIMKDKTSFVNFETNFRPENHFIELADGSRSNVAQARGTAKVMVLDSNGKPKKITLESALYVPSYRTNIFSVQAATAKGAAVNFEQEHGELIAKDSTKFPINKRGKLYFLNSAISTNREKHNIQMWHQILGHCNIRDILKLENVAKGMKISSKSDFQCGTCAEAKMSEFRSRIPDDRAQTIFDFVHCDLAGPIMPASDNGFRYAISFVDDYSGMIMVYFLKRKSDTWKATEKFLADIAPFGVAKHIRTDNGSEFTCSQFEELLVKNRIKHEKSAPYSPHQNGTVERTWRSLFEMARCVLLESKLPKFLWPYAVSAAAYIRNRCYNSRIDMTPYGAVSGKMPNLSLMHIFGTICFALKQNVKKLDPRSEKGIFVGYDRGSPAYLVYFPESRKVKKVRCVKFTDRFTLETGNGGQAANQPPSDSESDSATPHDPDSDSDVPENAPENPGRDQNSDVPENVVQENPAPENPDQDQDAEQDEATRRYPLRNRKPPGYLKDYETEIVSTNIDYCYHLNSTTPRSYNEAMSSAEATKWHTAMEEEMQALRDNDTFEITQKPDGRKVIGGRWVYTIKDNQGAEQYKARYVAKGYSQVKYVDFQETFSPTAKMSSIRMLMHLTAQFDLVVHQLDVKAAYLNAPIDCEIFMEQPDGFTELDKKGEKLVYRLKKSLYGLKQSGRNWNNLLHEYLVQENFIQSQADTCVYTRQDTSEKIILIVWVDDIAVAANSNSVIQRVKDSLCSRFKMRDLGVLSCFLGIEFNFDANSITVCQTKYILKVLDRFNMSDCKPRSTPYEMSVSKISDRPEGESVDSSYYRAIVGSLIYAMTSTRPDLCYIVTKLSQHLSNPVTEHLTMAKHVLRYLKSTKDVGLVFTKSDGPLVLTGFSDADWGAASDRRSITGYAFRLSESGPLITWKSKKQQTVALSTCEAEYMALAAATQEAKYLVQLVKDMCQSDKSNVATLMVDNQGALALAKNPVHHQRTKHIDIRYHYIRSEVESGKIHLEYVSSQENIADIFTKPVPRLRLEKFVRIIFNVLK